VTYEWKKSRESWRETVVGEGECEGRREIESWSLLGRVERREVIARESVTDTMDSGWGSDFHRNSTDDASSSSMFP
jgi:hypothetical protein